MLGLGEHIGGDKVGLGLGGNDQDLGGTGHEIDADLARKQFLGGGHIDVTGSDDAVGTRNGLCAIGESRDGLRAAHAKNLIDAQVVRRGIDFVDRLRTGYADIFHAGGLGRNSRHDQGRGQWIAARRDVAADRVQRPDDLPAP